MASGRASESLSVCVVGSGIAGLSVAWLLTQQQNKQGNANSCASPPLDVHLYEKADALGMDADALDHVVEFVDAAGVKQQRKVRLDMPLRVFTESYYPHLTGLYNEVGVEYAAEDYSASFTTYVEPDMRCSDSLVFGYRNFLVGALSLPLLFLPLWRSLWTPSCWIIVRDLARFHWHARSALKRWAAEQRTLQPDAPKAGMDVSMGRFLATHGYSEDFKQRMLIPALAGILTCSHGAVLRYPAPIVLTYWLRRSMWGVRRVCRGTQDVVNTLTKHVRVQLSTSVTRVQSEQCAEDPSRTRVRVTDSTGSSRLFDRVVLACQANQAAAMLAHEDDPDMLEALRGIKYERSRLVTHTDASLMPHDRHAWNSVNFILPADSKRRESSAVGAVAPMPSSDATQADSNPSGLPDREGMCTIWLNRAQSSLSALGPSATLLFQTWNPLREVRIKPECVLHDACFERPVVTAHSLQCIERLHARQGQRGIFLCGSYSELGMPLLETAVTSSVRVAQALGYSCPWTEGAAKQQSTGSFASMQLRSMSGLLLLILLPLLAMWASTS